MNEICDQQGPDQTALKLKRSLVWSLLIFFINNISTFENILVYETRSRIKPLGDADWLEHQV